MTSSNRNVNGAEFSAAIQDVGFTQVAFANMMGVHRETIGNQIKKEKVPLVWVYALAGAVAISNNKPFNDSNNFKSMAGTEFNESLKTEGFTQVAFATILDVHRETIANQIKKDEVPCYWVYALVGVVAMNQARQLNNSIDSILKRVAIKK